jgi:hypothetical protein
MYGRKGVVVVLVCTVRRPEGLLAHLALTPYHSGMKRRAAVMNPNDAQISHAKSQMRRSFPGAMRCLVGVVFPGSWCAEIEEAISDALARGNGKAGALEQLPLEGSKGGACVGIKELPRAVPAHLPASLGGSMEGTGVRPCNPCAASTITKAARYLSTVPTQGGSGAIFAALFVRALPWILCPAVSRQISSSSGAINADPDALVLPETSRIRIPHTLRLGVGQVPQVLAITAARCNILHTVRS